MNDRPNPEDMPKDMDAYRARQKGRNRALGLVLIALAVLFFAITIVKIGVQVGAH